MRRPLLLIILVSVLMALMAPAAAGRGDPPSSSPIKGKWERLSYGDDPTAEASFREVRVFRRMGDEWASTFKFQNDPRLGEPQPISATLGDFRGVEVDVSTVDCSPSVCPADITFALDGTSTFDLRGEAWTVPTQFVTTESGMAWWIALFGGDSAFTYRTSCPWYRDFDAALAANPDFTIDCIEAVEFPTGTPVYEFFPTEKNCTDGYDNDGDGDVDLDDSDCPG